jgi:tetraacyldisaccharide 4'-kinase
MAGADARPRWQQILLAAWRTRGPLAWLLWPVSALYGGAVAARRAGYRSGVLGSTRLPVPVIVVGNVVAGGGGKTPVVMALVQHLSARGFRPGVVSRGYGRRDETACVEVQPDSDPALTGDEPLLIRRRCGVPVTVASGRVAAAQALLAAHPEVDILVCDDGLQHLALQRDIEVCVFDRRGLGNGFLLPAGPLREPWPRPRDAQAPVLLALHTAAPGGAHGWGATRALHPIAHRADGSTVALDSLRDQPLHALAGIAEPDAFFDMLRAFGLTLQRTEALPDHYSFDSNKAPFHAGNTVICTEKDATKLWRWCPQALAVRLDFTPDAGFMAALDEAVDQLRAPRLSSRHGHPTA